MILLKRDSRLFQYHQTFTGTTTFLPNLELDAGFLDVQPIGDVSCTCYSADKVKSGETGKRYDHIWLWTQMVQAGKTTLGGASPKDAFAIAVKGQRVVPTGEIDTSAGYFQCETGPYDFFTNVKSVIQSEYIKGNKRPVACGTYWYSEWQDVTILPEGKAAISAHEWVVCGWEEAHPNCFKIDTHEGYYKYIPQDVFNKAMDVTYGSVALTIAETSQEIIDTLKATKVSLLQRALDLCFNIFTILQAKIRQKPSEPVSIPAEPPVVPQESSKPEPAVIVPKYDWSTPDLAKHTVRVICDEEGLNVEQKNSMCATIGGESGWQSYYFTGPKKGQPVCHENYVIRNGVRTLYSTDWGICQWNDYYHNKEITKDESLNNPEKAVRLMCAYWKRGQRDTWIAYANGSYKRYL